MRAAVIGANGQLGSDACAALAEAGHEVVPLTHAEIELADAASVRAALEAAGADVVINTAAAHNVEGCEAEPEHAFRINAVGTRNLAIATRETGGRLIHVSTDYVFDGTKGAPYVESDRALPLNVYGNSKLAGEHFALAELERVAVVRTSGLYGRSACRAKQGGLNFVQLMRKLGAEKGEVTVVVDERVSPTPTHALARQLVALAATEHRGIFHATTQGECSWHEFAVEIFRLSGMDVKVHEGRASAMPRKVRRPAYSVLDNAALREAGIDVMPHWREGLAEYVAMIGGKAVGA